MFLMIAVVSGLIVWHLSPKRARKPSPFLLKALANEVASEGEFNKSPIVDPTGSQLAFARTANGGRAMFFMDVLSGAEKQLQNPNEIYQANGFSRDGCYLLFTDVRPTKDRIVVLDRHASSARVLAEGRMDNIAWMNSNAFCFTDRHTNFGSAIILTPEGAVTNQFDMRLPAYCMAPSGPVTVSFITDAGIWSLDLASGAKECMTPSNNPLAGCWNEAYEPEWLTYSPEIHEFLFCSWDQSNFRHLFRLARDPNGWKLKQETAGEEHTYNGRWIQHGKGFAFIGNRTNHFYLAVRPADPKGNTNLFYSGHTFGYTVSDDGDQIYAIASIGAEPLGIWEYTISSRTLRYLGGRAKLSKAEAIPREEHWVSSFDGLKISYYFLTPCHLEKSKKYPAVIFLPIWGMQNFPAWEMFSQFFANIGVFHVAVNHRGVDGYGKAYSELGVFNADKDVNAVYEDIVKNPNIDKKRIFLMTYSEAASVANQVIQNFPGRWAGVINIAGTPPPRDQVKEQGMRVFLFVGGQDSADLRQNLMFFESWAAENGVTVHVMRPDGTRHIITRTEVDRNIMLELADFIFAD